MAKQGEHGITWTEQTWNPIRGCTRVSAGCVHCYAERTAARFSGPGQPYEGLAEMTPSGPRWTGEVRLIEEHLTDPLRWKKPRLVFVNSTSDLFHERLSDGQIARIWNVMLHAPQHTYQVLTKRPERMLRWVSRWADLAGEPDDLMLVRGPEATRAAHPSGRGQLFAKMLEAMGTPPDGCAYPTFDWCEGWRWMPEILPHIWLGVSVEDQATADERIPLLLQTPAEVRWISAEPLLGPIDLREIGTRFDAENETWTWLNAVRGDRFVEGVEATSDAGCEHLDWVVAGGESGPGARWFDPHWVRDIRDACIEPLADGEHCAAFHFKQWGEFNAAGERVGKRAAGRELDGRTWDEYPAAFAGAAR